MGNTTTKQDLEVGEYDKYYQHTWWCDNCQNRNYTYILKRVRISEVTLICEKCGCVQK